MKCSGSIDKQTSKETDPKTTFKNLCNIWIL